MQTQPIYPALLGLDHPSIRWQGEIELPAEEEMRTARKAGCRFYPRCPHRMDRCLEELPPQYEVGTPGRVAACYLHDRTPQAAE